MVELCILLGIAVVADSEFGERLCMEIVSGRIYAHLELEMSKICVFFVQLSKNLPPLVLPHRARTSKVQYTGLPTTSRAVRIHVGL